MRIELDRDRCEGHGLCLAQAPAVLDLDDDGELVELVPDGELPADQEAPARAAVAACPVAALRLA